MCILLAECHYSYHHLAIRQWQLGPIRVKQRLVKLAGLKIEMVGLITEIIADVFKNITFKYNNKSFLSIIIYPYHLLKVRSKKAPHRQYHYNVRRVETWGKNCHEAILNLQ